MKKTAIMTIIAATALIAAGSAFAHMSAGGGPGMGYGDETGNPVNVENLKKFQKETLSLRDELITKQAELSNEYDKATPDTARISELRQQIIDIQAKIRKAAEKNGLTAWGRGPDHGYYNMGPGMMYSNGYMGMGPGMRYGYGSYGDGCGAW